MSKQQKQLGTRLLICNPPWMSEILDENFTPLYGTIIGIQKKTSDIKCDVYEITGDDGRLYRGHQQNDKLFIGEDERGEVAIFMTEEELRERLSAEIRRRNEIIARLEQESLKYGAALERISREINEKKM